jgi:hypothetical protein
MNTRVAYAILATAVLTGAAAVAQTSDQSARDVETDEPITVAGCLQRESDYRRQNDSGKGGILGTGAGRGNEYILVDSAGQCGTLAPGAAAYELTGSSEKDLAQFVGRRVEITGVLKAADLTADGRAEGGLDPLGQELHLREVEVTSFRDAAMLVQAGDAASPNADADAVGTAGAQTVARADTGDNDLPRTASPLALAGILGLLSAGGGLGFRAVRRRLSSLR